MAEGPRRGGEDSTDNGLRSQGGGKGVIFAKGLIAKEGGLGSTDKWAEGPRKGEVSTNDGLRGQVGGAVILLMCGWTKEGGGGFD